LAAPYVPRLRASWPPGGTGMIVWLSSFPRSGNTYVRVLLRHLYDAKTYAGPAASEDLTTIGAEDLTGIEFLPEETAAAIWRDAYDAEPVARMERADAVYFIKSHKPMQRERVLVILRDARDAYVSLANYFIDVKFTWASFLSFKPNMAFRVSSP